MKDKVCLYFFIVCIASVLLLLAAEAFSQDCRTQITDYISWIKSKPEREMNCIVVSVKKLTNPSKISKFGHSSYMYVPSLKVEGAGHVLAGHRSHVLFSDRDLFRGPQDTQSIYISDSGEVDLTLHSWGQTRLRLEQVSCPKQGFITGFTREANGVSAVTIILSKFSVVRR